LKFVDAPSSQTAGGLTFRELVFKEESIQTLILTRLAGQSLVASCRFFSDRPARRDSITSASKAHHHDSITIRSPAETGSLLHDQGITRM